MTYRNRLLVASALVGAFTIAGSAFAQDAPPTPGADASAAAAAPGDIVVTAQRREQTLQNTPVAVSAFNPQMLQTRGITDVIKIAQSTPSLFLAQGTASPSTLQVGMRGALEQNGGTITSESPVAIYVDDVYQSRLSAANYDIADIQRVEVLRGPQGTLYGRNSMTGAIKLITRQPNGQTWLNTDVSFASFDEVKAKASMGAPLTDNIALAASAFYDERNKGWQYNETLNEKQGTFRHYGGQVALGLTNVDKVEAVVTARYLHITSDGQHFMPMAENFGTGGTENALPFYDTATPAEAKGNNESYSVSAKLGYDFGNVQVKSITAYQHLKEEWALDFAGGYSFTPTSPVILGFYRDSPGRQHQITQEFQVLGKALNDKLHYIAGFFFFDERAYQYTMGDIFTGFQALPSDIRTKSRSYAGYTQADYEVIPNLTASVGIRFTHDEKSFFGHTPIAHTVIDPETEEETTVTTVDPKNAKVKSDVWTPKFNLEYKFADHGMVYGTISRGYRAGGFNSLNTGNPEYGAPYKPETVWSYELGAKVDAFDRMLQVNVAAYYEQLKNLQTLAFGDTAGSFIFQNAAEAKVEGVEIESTLRPTRDFSLFGNVTYTHDRYQKLDPGSQAAQTGAYRLPLISRWQWQIGGQYDLPLGQSTLSFAMDYSYRSPYYALVTLAPSSRQKAIGRGNGSITYKAPNDRYEVYAQASNIFNSKDYFASAEFVSGVFGYRIPLEPRIIRVGFRFKY